MLNIGLGELLLLMVLALIVFGPARLPEVLGSVGRAIAEFRRASQELTDVFSTEMNSMQAEISTLQSEVSSLGSEVEGAVSSGVSAEPHEASGPAAWSFDSGTGEATADITPHGYIPVSSPPVQEPAALHRPPPIFARAVSIPAGARRTSVGWGTPSLWTTPAVTPTTSGEVTAAEDLTTTVIDTAVTGPEIGVGDHLADSSVTDLSDTDVGIGDDPHQTQPPASSDDTVAGDEAGPDDTVAGSGASELVADRDSDAVTFEEQATSTAPDDTTETVEGRDSPTPLSPRTDGAGDPDSDQRPETTDTEARKAE